MLLELHAIAGAILSHSCLSLIPVSVHRPKHLMHEQCRCLSPVHCHAKVPVKHLQCRLQHESRPLLDGKVLNVSIPSIKDLADSLPTAWKRAIVAKPSTSTVCRILDGIDNRQSPTSDGPSRPGNKWLDDFWSLVSGRQPTQRDFPAELQTFALVPLTDGRLASFEHCHAAAALTHQHLQWMPSTAAATLSAVGCLCIADSRAESASPIPRGTEPLTKAIDTTARRNGESVHELLSQKKLGERTFSETRHLLAYHILRSSLAWAILRGCPIFEGTNGAAEQLPSGQLGLLPNARWEDLLTALQQVLPWSPVKYHRASDEQKTLLQPHLSVPSLSDFLHTLLSAINKGGSSSHTEPLLLQALDDLSYVSLRQGGHALDNIFVDNHLHPISRWGDSTSNLNKMLFSQEGSTSEHVLLPEKYTTPQRLTVLKKQGLGHAGADNPAFFLQCASQFSTRSSSMSRDDSRRVSRYLVDMLHNKLSSFMQSSDLWSKHQQDISACKVFTRAQLSFPYSTNSSSSISTAISFVSLSDSEDHDHHRLVALAVPVTDSAHGDTKWLRTQLGLQAGPKLQHVVQHLVQTASAGHLETAAQNSANLSLQQLLLDDVQQAYQHIVDSISSSDPALAQVTDKLMQEPWVLVQGCKFVRPHELCFDLAQDINEGEF